MSQFTLLPVPGLASNLEMVRAILFHWRVSLGSKYVERALEILESKVTAMVFILC